MAFKVDVRTKRSVKPDAAQEITTRVSVTGDTPEEAEEICRLLEALRPHDYSQLDPSVPALPPPSETQEEADPLARGEPVEPRAESVEERGQGVLVPPSLGTATPPQATDAAPPLSLQQAVDAYLNALVVTGSSAITRKNYAYTFNRLAKRLGESRSVKQIAADDMVSYLTDLRAGGLSPTSLAVYGQTFKGFFRWLVERGEIEASPMAAIKLKHPPPNPVPPFSDDEIHRILEAATTPMEQAAITLLLDTGLRASELAGLQLDNIDLEAGKITVRGKGNKVRVVALNGRPRKALEAYLAQRIDISSTLWPEGWERKGLTYLLQKIGIRAGIARVHPHRFRHTFASRFLAATGDALALKALLGHSSLMMTQRYISFAETDRALGVHKEHPPSEALP